MYVYYVYYLLRSSSFETLSFVTDKFSTNTFLHSCYEAFKSIKFGHFGSDPQFSYFNCDFFIKSFLSFYIPIFL